MTISAACNQLRLRKTWYFVALVGLMGLLGGCIDPAAPPLNATLPALPNTPIPGATVIPPTIAPATIPPATPIGATAPPQALPLAADGLWQQIPLGPEFVAIVFYHNPPQTGVPCLSYVFRQTSVQRCTSNQALALVAGTIQTADGKQHTVLAGRSLNGQVSGVSIEFADGTFQSMGISAGGFSLILDGIHKPVDVVPVDQYGNLVGGKVPF